MTEYNNIKSKVVDSIKAMKKGPLPMRIYMETCVKCGTCAEVCPVYYGSNEKSLNPAERSDLIRRVYKKHSTISGKIFGGLVGAKDFDGDDIDKWAKEFYECTACRRCAVFCPMEIDNSVLTRKARTILDSIGKTPETLMRVIEVSLKTGNTDNAPPVALTEATSFMEEEILEETGVEVKMPVDEVGVDYFLVPPSGDVLVNPESMMGIAKVFHVTGDSWTLSSRAFDGANYGLFTGSDNDMKEDNKLYVEEAKRLKVKTMMMGECGHAHRIMKFIMEKNKWWGDLPFEISNILQYTAYHIQKGTFKFDKSLVPEPVTYHDPCNFGRSCGIIEEPRIIMRAACEDFREMYPNRGENWCCGGGGGLSAMDTIIDFRMNVSGKKKVEQVLATGAKYVASPCSNCKRQFMQLMEYHKLDIGTGGLHDLVNRSIILDGQKKSV
ncbi:MAG: (Fe-S)-binding protein [candidate division Zixibacteria bacterium]|nr:(Fe-S)-binding protein [Candidatus Tariuqbacter arcticus]